MTFASRDRDDVAGTDLFNRAAFGLNASDALGDDQRLAKRMGVPSGSGAGLEAH